MVGGAWQLYWRTRREFSPGTVRCARRRARALLACVLGRHKDGSGEQQYFGSTEHQETKCKREVATKGTAGKGHWRGPQNGQGLRNLTLHCIQGRGAATGRPRTAQQERCLKVTAPLLPPGESWLQSASAGRRHGSEPRGCRFTEG